MINWSAISLKELAGYVSEELRNRGIDAILVGGACVTIYTQNRYQSYDLDYVTYEDMKTLREALNDLGFIQKNRYFRHEGCPWFIEFVSPPVAVGNEPIREFNQVATPFGTIKLLRPVDSVKDRLGAFYHWNDKQGLEQAINLCQEQEIDLEEIKAWSINEDHLQKLQIFLARLEKH